MTSFDGREAWHAGRTPGSPVRAGLWGAVSRRDGYACTVLALDGGGATEAFPGLSRCCAALERPRLLVCRGSRSRNVYQYTWDAARVSALVFGGYCCVKLAWELAYETMPDAFRSAELAKASGALACRRHAGRGAAVRMRMGGRFLFCVLHSCACEGGARPAAVAPAASSFAWPHTRALGHARRL